MQKGFHRGQYSYRQSLAWTLLAPRWSIPCQISKHAGMCTGHVHQACAPGDCLLVHLVPAESCCSAVQVYPATKVHCLPATGQEAACVQTTGVVMTRSEYVWMLYMQWQCNDGG